MSNPPEGRVALWLQPLPRSPLFEVLHQTITGLKPLFDDAVKFQPHVTITSGIQILSKHDVESILDRMAAAIKAVPHVDVVFNDLTFGSYYYRKVVMEVVRSRELVSLAAIARELFVVLPALIAQEKNYTALSEAEHNHIHQQAMQMAQNWAESEFKPHLSLVYSNVWVSESQKLTVDQRLRDVFGPLYKTRGIGWSNGRISLVDVAGSAESWRVLGYRDF